MGKQTRISDATMRIRDVIYEGLLIRTGLVLDEPLARERAANLCTAVVETLAQLAADAAAARVEGQDVIAVPEPLGVEITPAGRVAFHETDDELARRLIR